MDFIQPQRIFHISLLPQITKQLSITAQTAAYGGGASGMADGRYVTPVRVEYEYQIAVDSNGKPFPNDAAYKAAVFVCKRKAQQAEQVESSMLQKQ